MDELKKLTACTKIVSKGYGEGSGERGRFWRNPDTGQIEPYNPERREVNAPFVIGDELKKPLMSMTGTDKIHYHKSTLRREYKELGFEEIGNESTFRPKKPLDREKRALEIRDTIKKSMNDIKYNNVPVSEQSAELYKTEEREWESYKKRQQGR